MNIEMKTLVLGQVNTNCYLVWNTETKEGFVIDPADDAECIMQAVKEEQVAVKAVYLTHAHFDHMLAASAVAAAFRASVYCLVQEKEVAESTRWNLSDYFGCTYALIPDGVLSDGACVQAVGMRMQVLHTPGHTKGSGCYYLEEEGLLFSGDTLFFESVGRTDFPTGNASVLEQSIREKLYVLPEHVKVYPGHGSATSIGYEKKNNMFVQA